VVVFLLALLLISALAFSVVAAFALPHLRAGSPVLTDRGVQLADPMARRLRPVTAAVWPRLRPVLRFARRAVHPLISPLVRAVRPRVAPLTEAISRAVEEGTDPSTVVRRPVPDAERSGPDGDAPAEEPGGAEVLTEAFGEESEVQRTVTPVRAPAPRPAAAGTPAPLARR
jgi:hypothetical protein